MSSLMQGASITHIKSKPKFLIKFIGKSVLVLTLALLGAVFCTEASTYAAADPSDSVTTSIDINVAETKAEPAPQPGEPAPDVPRTGLFTDLFGDGGEVAPVIILAVIGLVVIAFTILMVRRIRKPKLQSPLKKKVLLAARVSAILVVLGGVGIITLLPRGTKAAEGDKLIELSIAEQSGVINAVKGEALSRTVELKVSIETASQNDLDLTIATNAENNGIEISADESISLPAGTTSTTVPVNIKVSNQMAVGRYAEPIELTVNIKEGFWRASGRDVVDRYGMVTFLKGMNFETAGSPWYDTDLPVPQHFMITHSEFVYSELEELGINAIRLDFPARMLFDSCTTPACLTYDYVDEYFEIFDQMLERASRHGVGIIFNVHNSFGNTYPRIDNDGMSFKWNTFLPENIEKTTELWRKVATRFVNHKSVIGFDIMNEPFVRLEAGETSDDGIAKWDTVAQSMINEIRKIDGNHMIVVERAASCIRDREILVPVRADYIFPDVSDPMENLMLEFHEYGLGDWGKQSRNRIENDPWVWGDPNKSVLATGSISSHLTWPPATYSSTNNPQGEWVTIENNVDPISVPAADPEYNLGTISIHAYGTQAGMTIYIDEIKVDQYDVDGVFEKTVHEETFRYHPRFGSNSSESTTTETDAALCYDDEGGCAKIFGPPSTAGGNVLLQMAAGEDRFFHIDSTKKYKVTAKVYGENLPSGVSANIYFAYYQGNDQQVMPLGKGYLNAKIQKFVDASKERNTPIFNGEWGLLKFGEAWAIMNGGQYAADFLEVHRENKVSSAYFSYAKSVFWPNLDINSYYGMRVKPQGQVYSEPLSAENTVLNTVLYDAFLNDKIQNQ